MKIKITSGIYGLNENGRIKPKTSCDEPFEVDDIEAERLLSLGVAKKVDPAIENPADSKELLPEAGHISDDVGADDENAELEISEEDEDTYPSYSDKSDIQELKDIAKTYGISFSPNIGKEKLLKKLDDFFKEPDLSAGDPVI